MERRELLAALAGGTSAGLGGCLNTANKPGPGTASTQTTTPTPPQVTISSLSCPPFATEGGEVICSHTADPESVPVFLDADPRTVRLENGTPSPESTITFQNNSDRKLTFTENDWSLWRRTHNGWRSLKDRLHVFSKFTVAPGSSKSESFMSVVHTSTHLKFEPVPEVYGITLTVSGPNNLYTCVTFVEVNSR